MQSQFLLIPTVDRGFRLWAGSSVCRWHEELVNFTPQLSRNLRVQALRKVRRYAPGAIVPLPPLGNVVLVIFTVYSSSLAIPTTNKAPMVSTWPRRRISPASLILNI